MEKIKQLIMSGNNKGDHFGNTNTILIKINSLIY